MLEQLIQTYYMTSDKALLTSSTQVWKRPVIITSTCQRIRNNQTIEQTQLELEESHKQRQLEQEQIESKGLIKQQTTKRDKLSQTQTQRKKTVGSIKKNILH